MHSHSLTPRLLASLGAGAVPQVTTIHAAYLYLQEPGVRNAVKRRLEERLQALLAPIRERRAEFAARPDHVRDVIRDGTARARELTQATLEEVRGGIGLFSFG